MLYVFAVMKSPEPFEKKLIVDINHVFDDETILLFILHDDLALMRDIIVVDDVDAQLIDNFECRPLRDDDGAFFKLADPNRAGLAVTQETFKIRKLGTERDDSR